MLEVEERQPQFAMDEYLAVRNACGLIERTDRAFLIVTGDDAYSWLQGMVSNDVRQLQERASRIQACILNSTGHMLADLAIIKHPAGLLLDLDRVNLDKILALLEGFIITEDVELLDRTETLTCLSLQGPNAPDVGSHIPTDMFEVAAPADHTCSGGLDLYVSRSQAVELRDRLKRLGAVEVGLAAAEVLRIEAGIPNYGVDMDEETIPLEAGLEATHVSYSKGCYVGQEIIARIQSRGHTNRALTGFLVEGDELPSVGAAILPQDNAGADLKPIGKITSAATSPGLQRPIALGYLRHEYRTAGSVLVSAGGMALHVAALPFVLPQV